MKVSVFGILRHSKKQCDIGTTNFFAIFKIRIKKSAKKKTAKKKSQNRALKSEKHTESMKKILNFFVRALAQTF